MSDESSTTPTEGSASPGPKDAASAAPSDGNVAAAPTGESAPASSAKPTVDLDTLLEQAAKASSQARDATRRAEIAEKAAKDNAAKLARLEGLESKKTTNVREAIRDLLGEGYKPQQIIEELSLDVEVPTDLPVADLVKSEVKKAQEADAAARAAKEAEAATAREAAKVAESKAIQNEFLKEVDAFTDAPDTAAKFPLSAAWAKKITPALVLDTFRALTKSGKPNEPPDVMAAIEAGFQEEIDATPFGSKRPAAAGPLSIHDEVQADLDRMEALERSSMLDGEQPLKRADPNIPAGAPVPHGSSGKSIHDENLELLEKWDREADPRRRLGFGG